MITKEEFAKVVECLFMELPGLTMTTTEAKLRAMPHLGPQLSDYLTALRDPSTKIEDLVTAAAGLVDEFVADHPTVIDDAYDLYVDMSRHMNVRISRRIAV